MEFKDYYALLGVERTTPADAIKKAYRRLARKYHPDVSKEPDAEARFKEVQEAYEVLKDPEKRAAYDRLGSEWKSGQDFRPPPGWSDRAGGRSRPGSGGTGTRAGSGPGAGNGQAGEGVDPAAFSDFFEQLFGAGGGFADLQGGGAGGPGGRGGRRPGAIFQVRLDIDLEEAFRGATRTLQIPQPEGAPRAVTIRIPPGATDGETVHARLGESAGGAEVLAEIHLRKHRLFETEGRDVVLVLPVAPWELALGATVPVPTLDGNVDMRSPPGTQSGQRMRLKGRGLPGNPPGSQIVALKVVLPPATTPEARAVYETLRRELPFDPRAGL